MMNAQIPNLEEAANIAAEFIYSKLQILSRLAVAKTIEQALTTFREKCLIFYKK